jgi:hypothetical protein
MESANATSTVVVELADRNSVAVGTGGQGVSLKQAMGLLVAGIVAAGVYQLTFGKRIQEPTQSTVLSEQQTGKPSVFLPGDDINLGIEVTIGVGRLIQTLSCISDAQSAKSALPALQDIFRSVESLKGSVAKFPASGRETLADLTTRALPPLRSALDRVYAIPGASDVLEPVLDPLMATVDSIARSTM